MFQKPLIAALMMIPLFASANSRVEPLIGHYATSTGLHLQVPSAGCTSKAQFHFEEELVGNVHRFYFVRDKADLCRAYLPYGEMITFSFEELGLSRDDQFVVGNPSTPGRVLGF